MIVLMTAMIGAISLEIVLREVIGPLMNNPPWVSHISAPINTASQTLLVWVGILGSALAWKLRAHLGVDALVRIYPPKVRLVLDYLQTILVGLFSFIVLIVGGYLTCVRAIQTQSKMPGLESFNRAWFYSVLVISGVLHVIYCVYHLSHPKPVGDAKGQEEGARE